MNKITAQVATEAIINDARDYDLSTMKTVLAAAREHRVGQLYVDMLSALVADRQPGYVFQTVPSSTGVYPHNVTFGGYVLEDTHETRDGYPMSVYKSFITDTYDVVVDTNEYN